MMEAVFDRYREIIPEFPAFQDALKRPIPTHLRVNRLKIRPQTLSDILRQKGVEVRKVTELDESLLWAPGLEKPGNLLEYYLGFFHPQALTSCLVSLALPVEPYSFAIDLCASPGGKTSHMAQIMNNTGLLIANELRPQRHIALASNLARLGVFNSVITGYQAQEFPLRQRFDFVLADVPCSGEGRFRLSNGLPGRKHKDVWSGQQGLQKRIILRAFDLLKERGEMIYSTCTYNPEENESVVDFLLKNREAVLIPIKSWFKAEPGILMWKGECYDRQIQRAIRYYPHRVDSVGFFMARIGRGK